MTEKQTEENMLMEFIADTCFIDIEKKIDYPPTAISYGEKVIHSDKGDTIVPIGICTYGNIMQAGFFNAPYKWTQKYQKINTIHSHCVQ